MLSASARALLRLRPATLDRKLEIGRWVRGEVAMGGRDHPERADGWASDSQTHRQSIASFQGVAGG